VEAMKRISLDIETYSEAGYKFEDGKWCSAMKSKPGLRAVGAYVYTKHPSADGLCFAYGTDRLTLWVAGMGAPTDLLDHISSGGLVEAWNSIFEFWGWNNIFARQHGWPELTLEQMRDTKARSAAMSYPLALGDASKILTPGTAKLAEGRTLIKRFCVPRTPTKHNKAQRIHPSEDPVKGPRFWAYNIRDVEAEYAIGSMLPELSEQELKVWQCDQQINDRGVKIDTDLLACCKEVVEGAFEDHTKALIEVTGGAVRTVSEIDRFSTWLAKSGYPMPSIDKDHVTEALEDPDLPKECRKALEIRQILGSSSVKKLYAIEHMLGSDGRLRGLFEYCGALRTGRWSGRGPQPQNLPGSGPGVVVCPGCNRVIGKDPFQSLCPSCHKNRGNDPKWDHTVVKAAIRAIESKDHRLVALLFRDAVSAVSGCLRALFVAADGHELMCSDYSAIEAVVLAVLAGETWRQEVFRTHGMIYEMSASKITGIPFQEFLDHKEQTGEHHPMRKKIGKVAELAGGYGGGVGAYLAFGADKFIGSDEKIKEVVYKWREENSMIVRYWDEIEVVATQAIQHPGREFAYRGITFVRDAATDVLKCRLLSGRHICYASPKILPKRTPWGTITDQITYMGWNTNERKGRRGWTRLSTWGGKLTENITQAVARDIMAYAIVRLEEEGFRVVLHVHDEVCCEILRGSRTIEELESIMSTMPYWAQGWPVKARGGWCGRQYRKD